MGISADLVGTKVLLDVNPDDISTILAYTDDGSELGYLRASGVWGNRPHSLKTRKEAMKYTRENMSKNNPFFAPLTEYENLLKERAAKSRNSRTKAERINREQERQQTEDYKLSNDEDGRVQNNIVDFKTKVEDTNNTNVNKTISELNGPSIDVIDELEYEYKGITSVKDSMACLHNMDIPLANYPSEIILTQLFLPEAYSEKKRLAASANIVWEAFLELIQSNNIPDADIPMKYFMKAIVYCLKTYGVYGKGIYFPDKKAWVDSVKNSGYLKSLQCIGM